MNKSLIELAAERLEQLRRAGIQVPDVERAPASPAARPVAPTETTSVAIAARLAEVAETGRGEGSAVPPAVTPSADLSPPVAKVAPPSAESPVVAARSPAARQPAFEDSASADAPPPLELDLKKLAAKGFITPAAPRSLAGDQYRVIKRPLIRNAMGAGASTLSHGNLIMVTSALSGEGKSFTSINLAMSIAAELDHTVMLVDADVARPSVLRMLEVDGDAKSEHRMPGLLDVLDGKVNFHDVLLRTNIEGLTILPSGSYHERATELLASEAMKTLLDDMATRYPDRIVIFDSPPLLLTTESRVLATQMGQVVVVVHAERTLQSVVQNALATIETCPVRMLLLNQARSASEGAYGYGYGYGYGGPRGKDTDTPAQVSAAAA